MSGKFRACVIHQNLRQDKGFQKRYIRGSEFSAHRSKNFQKPNFYLVKMADLEFFGFDTSFCNRNKPETG